MRIPGMLYGAPCAARTRARASFQSTCRRRAPSPASQPSSRPPACPGKQKVGHLKKDYDVLIPVGGITHFLGDAVALVAAETKEALEEAKKLVAVEYEELSARPFGRRGDGGRRAAGA